MGIARCNWGRWQLEVAARVRVKVADRDPDTAVVFTRKKGKSFSTKYPDAFFLNAMDVMVVITVGLHPPSVGLQQSSRGG